MPVVFNRNGTTLNADEVLSPPDLNCKTGEEPTCSSGGIGKRKPDLFISLCYLVVTLSFFSPGLVTLQKAAD